MKSVVFAKTLIIRSLLSLLLCQHTSQLFTSLLYIAPKAIQHLAVKSCGLLIELAPSFTNFTEALAGLTSAAVLYEVSVSKMHVMLYSIFFD